MAKRLRILDFSDRELLAVIRDATNGGTTATSQSIAAAIWPDAADPDSDAAFHGRSVVSSRLTWMRRYGLVDRTDRDWHLTEIGKRVLDAKIGGSVGEYLSKTGELNLLAVLERISSRYTQVDDTAATVLRRQWQYGQAQRNGRRP